MTSQAIQASQHQRIALRVGPSPMDEVPSQIELMRSAQATWASTDVKKRLRRVREFRTLLAMNTEQLIESVTYPSRNGPAETLAAEVIPLADACRFLEQNAVRVLAPRRLGRKSRPAWLRKVTVELRRDPFGVVLIVGAANYPLFLPGVQALQALVAGNAVAIKPAAESGGAADVLCTLLVQAGFDPELIQLLPEDNSSVDQALAAGVDKVVLTGSAATGRSVQKRLADTVTPSAMELSGCDSVFVLSSAKIEQVARALRFGLRFNNSATCIAPRRVFISAERQSELEQALVFQPELVEPVPQNEQALALVNDALGHGARAVIGGGVTASDGERLRPTILADVDATMSILSADVFAPVCCIVPVSDMRDALAINRQCPYALGATVFGDSGPAKKLAAEIDAGCVVINDMIAPTADPRVPFGGRRQSGFGYTRGAAGLEELTQLKSIVCQNSGWLPHLDEPTPYDAGLLSGFLKMSHSSSLRHKVSGLRSVVKAIVQQQKWMRNRRTETCLEVKP